jgi:ABC-type nitrate/sulfonate/bicarbonate transport system substrate-binding protein
LRVSFFDRHTADKIRIGYPDFNSSTFTLPLAQIRGFFNEEGLEAELIRIRSAVALPALVSREIDYHTVIGPGVAAVPLKLYIADLLKDGPKASEELAQATDAHARRGRRFP